MRVMVIVKATESSEKGVMPDESLMAEMGRFNELLVDAGVMRAGEGLRPSSEGVRIRFSDSQRTLTEGPFTETNELVAGFWIWDVESIEEAVEWVKRCPNPMREDSDIEIRPLYESVDFAESDPEGEQRGQEEALRQRLADQSALMTPYLFFAGRCEEALNFYQQAIGAKVSMLMRYSQCPVPLPSVQVPGGNENNIMHATLHIGETTIMASDGGDADSNFAAFRLAVTLRNRVEAVAAFNALAEDGTVDMDLQQTFWSPCYGLVTDRFGVGWMVMVSS